MLVLIASLVRNISDQVDTHEETVYPFPCVCVRDTAGKDFFESYSCLAVNKWAEQYANVLARQAAVCLFSSGVSRSLILEVKL